MTPQERVKDILDKIETILISSVPLGDKQYLKETKEVSIVLVNELLSECNDTKKYDYLLETLKEIKKL